MTYPRALLINFHVFNQFTGGGIALLNYFQGWPTGSIAAMYGQTGNPDDRICQRFYRLGDAELGLPPPFGAMGRVKRDTRTGPGNGQPDRSAQRLDGAKDVHWARTAIGRVLHGAAHVLEQTLRKGARSILSADGISNHARLTPSLRRWIADFAPEVVFTTLGSLGYMRLVKQVLDAFSVPMVVQIADDWPAAIYHRGLLAPFLRRQATTELKYLLDRAAERMAISDSMARAYQQRYGHPFMTIMPPVDVAAWRASARQDWRAGSPFRIAYVGTIVPNAQMASLATIADAVASLYDRGVNVEFLIYVPSADGGQHRPHLQRLPAVRVVDAPVQGAVAPLMGSMDLLVLPINFDQNSLSYVRYSMPGKVSAYLASGTPVLVYGPAAAAPVEYARESGWGYTVSSEGVFAVSSAIGMLMDDQGLREKLARQALHVALERHDLSRVVPEFQAALFRAAGRPASIAPVSAALP